MYLVASVRLSVRPSISELSHTSKEQRRSHQSNEFICVSNNRADAVDQLLIFYSFLLGSNDMKNTKVANSYIHSIVGIPKNMRQNLPIFRPPSRSYWSSRYIPTAMHGWNTAS